MDELTEASHKLAEAIYAQTTQNQQASQAKSGNGSKEKVVDAEFEETGDRS